MVRHIVIWDYNEKFNERGNKENAKKIKEGLEGLVKRIDGIAELKVVIDPLDTSSGDLMLNSLFESIEAFDTYRTHPDHLAIASFVADATQNRRVMDYIETIPPQSHEL